MSAPVHGAELGAVGEQGTRSLHVFDRYIDLFLILLRSSAHLDSHLQMFLWVQCHSAGKQQRQKPFTYAHV